jgi:hypothetical protein
MIRQISLISFYRKHVSISKNPNLSLCINIKNIQLLKTHRLAILNGAFTTDKRQGY